MTKLTKHELEQRLARQRKNARKRAAGVLPPTRKERLSETAKVLVARGVTREELEAYTLAVLPVYRNDSGVTTYDFDKILNRLYHPSSTPPICEECNEEMDRYEDSADTGKGGYQCSLCGWSQDDE